jgi:maleylacetoacetate isomerase
MTSFADLYLYNLRITQQIAEIVNSGIQPLQNLAILRQVKTVELIGSGETSDVKAYSQQVIAKGLAAIEALVAKYAPLDSNLYAAGTLAPSIADICLVPQIYNARRQGLDLSAYPTITAIVERCEALPAFQLAAPQNQPDAKN